MKSVLPAGLTAFLRRNDGQIVVCEALTALVVLKENVTVEELEVNALGLDRGLWAVRTSRNSENN